MIVLDICLSDIPKDRITTARNGKKYCKMVVAGRRQPDKYGNDQNLYMQMSKEEKGKEKIYVGSGRTVQLKDSGNVADVKTGETLENVNFNEVNDGDLPF